MELEFEFEATLIEWRGPAPFLFAPVPPELSADIKAVSPMITYGWGCIPATATIGQTTYTTSLFPRQNLYLVPIKVAVQKAENITLGDQVQIRLSLTPRTP